MTGLRVLAPLLLIGAGGLPLERATQVAVPDSTGQVGSASWVSAFPDQARDSIRAWMAGAVRAGASATALRRAGQLAVLYVQVWGDSFPLREVRRFTAWPPAQRMARVRADSLRRAGNAALGREGLAAALRAWRGSLATGAELGDSALMAAALGNIGAGFYREGQADSALPYFSEARRLATQAGDQRTMLNALTGLASLRKDLGDLREAAELYGQSLALRRQIGDYRGIASDANNLGLVAAQLGDAEGARRRHMEALVTAREHGLDETAAAALLNLGALASEAGQEPLALRHYAEALALYRRLDFPADEALVLHNLGLLAAGNGDYPRAAGHYQAALDLLAVGGPAEQAVLVAADLAMVEAAMGRLERAERAMSVADRQARAAQLGPVTLGRLLLARGDLNFAFNRLQPARRAYTDGLGLFRRHQDRAGEAATLAALGALSLAEEDYAAARLLLTAAESRQREEGDARAAALTGLLVARATAGLGDSAAARRQVNAALGVLRGAGDPAAEAWAQCQLGDVERAAALPLAAEAAYRVGLARLGRRPAAGVAVCLTSGLAGVLREQRADAEAIRTLERGIAAIEATAGQLVLPAQRSDFLADKWQLYTDLALAQRATGSVAAAFATSERLRARQALDLVARGPAPPGPGREADPRLGVLRRRITALLTVESGSGQPRTLRGDDGLGQVSAARREALARAQSAYAALLDSLTPGAAAVPATSSEDIAAGLGRDEALIEYMVTDSVAVAFVVTRSRIQMIDLPTNGRVLATAVDFLRGTLNSARARSPGAPWRAPLRRLHRELIAPLEEAALLRGVRRLVLVPHGELHYLPFAALLGGDGGSQFLVERYQLGYAPSAAVWLELRRRPATAGTGILALAPHPGDLPGTRTEVGAISRLFGNEALVLSGPRASRTALRQAAPGRAILHLATQGVLNKHNPQFSFVALAPTGEDDGRLEVHDVAGLRLSARLVVLSACQTALGSGRVSDVPAGDDWVSLVQAFQTAGAANVLATLWPVDDRATAALMEEFYRSIRAGQTEGEALMTAQRALIRRQPGRSPFYWAGFLLNGRL